MIVYLPVTFTTMCGHDGYVSHATFECECPFWVPGGVVLTHTAPAAEGKETE